MKLYNLAVIIFLIPLATFSSALEEESIITILNVYFFNWTNPEDVGDPTIKPNFVEVGPYRYKKVQCKANNTVFNEYYFDEDNSPNNENDLITTINYPGLAIANKMNTSSFFLRYTLNSVFGLLNIQVHLQKSVGELLFKGYQDDLLQVISSVQTLKTETQGGWFYRLNGSMADEEYYISSPNETVQCRLFTNLTETKTNLSDILNYESILFSIPKLCNPIELNLEQDNVSLERRYGTNPKTKNENVDTISCYNETSIFLTFPHFLNGKPIYVNALEGLNPSKLKHETYIVFDRETKDVISSKVRLQVNALLEPMPDFNIFRNVTKLLFPVFWFEHILIDKPIEII